MGTTATIVQSCTKYLNSIAGDNSKLLELNFFMWCRPFRYSQKRTQSRAVLTIAVVWLFSCSVAVPPVFARKLFHGNNQREDLLRWGDVAFELFATLGKCSSWSLILSLQDKQDRQLTTCNVVLSHMLGYINNNENVNRSTAALLCNKNACYAIG